MATNKQTAEAIRAWCVSSRSQFSWPTDDCGYDQHIKFVNHRYNNWNKEESFIDFCYNYADSLEKE